MNAKVCAVLLIGLGACAGPQFAGTPSPDPYGVTNAADPAQRGAVLRYARSLPFDSITHGAWDRQPLTTVDTSVTPRRDTIVAIGTIYPQQNTHQNSPRDLRGVGRIVALIHSTQPYPRLGLRAGVSYYWVDSLVMITQDSGRGRAIFIPADSTQAITIRPMVFTSDRRTGRQALARWRYYPLHSALAWDRCTMSGCCEAQ